MRVVAVWKDSLQLLDELRRTTQSVDAPGWYARILQREIDHLSGRFYIDRMETLDKLQRSEPIRKREADAREARRAAGEDVDDDDDEEYEEEEPD